MRAVIATILGEPVACPRPRVAQGGRRTYYPARYETWRTLAVLSLRAQIDGGPLLGPLAVEIEAVHARPRSCPKGHKPWWGPGRVFKATRPDADNIAKAVLDALDAAGWLADDGQVVDLRVRQWYAAEGEDAGIALAVRELVLLPSG